MKICFVLASSPRGLFRSPEYYPSPLEQALLFQRDGHNVSILEVTDFFPPAEGTRFWQRLGIKAITLPRDAAKETEPFYPDLLELSWRTYHWLRKQAFDCIFFEDNSSASLMSVQAKKLGESFADTTLVYHLHGPAQWSAHLSDRRQLVRPDLVLPYAQQYAVENADVVVLPAEYFHHRIRTAGWKPGGTVMVLPYLSSEPAGEKPVRSDSARHLIYPLHHSDQAGLWIFLQALGAIRDNAPVQLTVLGYRTQRETKELAKRFPRHLPAHVVCKVLDEGQEPPDGEKSLWIFSPFWLNLPALLLHRAGRGNRLLVAQTSESDCIPELEGCRVPWNVPALAAKLSDDLSGAKRPRAHRVPRAEAEQAWSKLPTLLVRDQAPSVPAAEPRVSVCVAHFNKAEFLLEALESLRAQTYRNLEVIVVDDASSDPAAQAAFTQAEAAFSTLSWKFFRERENHGPGYARNRAVEQASGNFVLFFDADDVSLPTMVERMLHAIQRLGVDCVAGASHRLVQVDGRPQRRGTSSYVGGSLENAFLHPPAGTVFLISRELFWKVGGFKEDLARDCHEDWNFHIRLLAEEYRLHVLPDPVFAYRAAPESRTQLVTRNMVNNLEPFLKATPLMKNRLLLFALERAGALDSAVQTLAEYDHLAFGIRILRRLDRWKQSIRRRFRWLGTDR